MPIKPEEINASQLPVAMRGYQREAVDEFLLRVAWDYRQATRAQENWAKDEKKLKERVAELEAHIASADEQSARLQQAQQETFQQELQTRSAALEAELAALRAKVREHESRDEMTRTLLAAAQRSAKELRESTRQECESLLKAAQRKAAEIEHDAHASVRHASTEIERLRRLEQDLKAQLRRMLESVIGGDVPEAAPDVSKLPPTQPAPTATSVHGVPPAAVD